MHNLDQEILIEKFPTTKVIEFTKFFVFSKKEREFALKLQENHILISQYLLETYYQ